MNEYGYEKHELVDNILNTYEYCGTDTSNGIIYDCFLAPDGISYKAVCVIVSAKNTVQGHPLNGVQFVPTTAYDFYTQYCNYYALNVIFTP